MTDFVTVEITLSKVREDTYAVGMSSSLPGNDAEIRSWGEAQFDLGRLRALSLDTLDYARLLTDSLLRDIEVRTAFANARVAAAVKELPLQVRLLIEPNAHHLHALRWETLLDIRDDTYLFTGEQVVFSRYLSSSDWQPVTFGPRRPLVALVVIANPINLADFRLTPVDVEAELTRARKSLSNVHVTELPSGGTASLNNLSDRLRAERSDILYLICHGALVDGESWLWLEDQAGKASRVRGSEVVASLKELPQRPRLIVLASCQGAGKGDEKDSAALTALGPRLIAAGVPAVVAMQGNVSMETLVHFMPAFFGELFRSGQIGRAMAVARGAVRNRPDFWMPVLFMRLQSGRLWPGDDPDRKDTPVPLARVVDAAMPSHVVIDRATELMVLVRMPDSKGLTGILQDDEEAEARPDDVRSKPFEVIFPVGPDGLPAPLRVTVQLTSPGFEPPSQIKNVVVPVHGDSPICTFLLTPTKIGSLLVIIELIWEDTQRGSRRLKTTCLAEAEPSLGAAGMTLVRVPFNMKPGAATQVGTLALATAPEPVNLSDFQLKRVRRFLRLDEDDLYLLIPEHLPQYSRSLFSPAGQRTAGRRAFEDLLSQLHDLICIRWGYCSRRDAAELRSIEMQVVTIAEVISAACGEIPPFVIATILVKRGLDTFCDCKM